MTHMEFQGSEEYSHGAYEGDPATLPTLMRLSLLGHTQTDEYPCNTHPITHGALHCQMVLTYIRLTVVYSSTILIMDTYGLLLRLL